MLDEGGRGQFFNYDVVVSSRGGDRVFNRTSLCLGSLCRGEERLHFQYDLSLHAYVSAVIYVLCLSCFTSL